MKGGQHQLRHDEQAFIQRLIARDEQAFNELVSQFQVRIYRFVFHFLNNEFEAEDLVQEVFVQVFKSIDQFRHQARLSTWIYKIATNLCINRHAYLKRRHQDAQKPFDFTKDGDVGCHDGTTSSVIPRPDEALEGMQVEQVIQKTIQDMSDDYRYPLILCDVEDLTYEEIATITAVPINTVRSRIYRAREQLRKAINSHFGDQQP